jgi:hypothetical protein
MWRWVRRSLTGWCTIDAIHGQLRAHGSV